MRRTWSPRSASSFATPEPTGPAPRTTCKDMAAPPLRLRSRPSHPCRVVAKSPAPSATRNSDELVEDKRLLENERILDRQSLGDSPAADTADGNRARGMKQPSPPVLRRTAGESPRAPALLLAPVSGHLTSHGPERLSARSCIFFPIRVFAQSLTREARPASLHR